MIKRIVLLIVVVLLLVGGICAFKKCKNIQDDRKKQLSENVFNISMLFPYWEYFSAKNFYTMYNIDFLFF